MKLKHLMEEPTSCKEALQATELTGYHKYLNYWLSYCMKNIHLKYRCKLDVNICNCLEKHSTFYNFWELSSIQSSIQLTNNSLKCPRSKQCLQNTWTSNLLPPKVNPRYKDKNQGRRVKLFHDVHINDSEHGRQHPVHKELHT